MIIKKTLKEGELSIIEKVHERIRTICSIDEETFFCSPHNPSDRGCDIIAGFLNGLWLGSSTCKD
jgi:hypothetical protein